MPFRFGDRKGHFKDCVKYYMNKVSSRTGKKFTKEQASAVCATIARKQEILSNETRENASESFWTNNWYKAFPKCGKGKFVYHHHWRGLSKEETELSEQQLFDLDRSVHGDLRFQFDKDSLFGFTTFLGTTKDVKNGRDVFTLSDKDKLQGTWKQLQPKVWLTYRGITAPGGVGSTSEKYAKFFIIDSGGYEVGVWREHFIELFLHGKKLKGRFLIVYAPVGGSRKWLIGRPENQEPYAKSHKIDDVIKELKSKHQQHLVWALPGERPKIIDVSKEQLSEEKKFTLSLHQLGLEKHFDLHLEKDGFADCWSFEPVKIADKNKISLGSFVKRKTKEPLAILEFEGVVPKGGPGSSRNYPGIIKILERGHYKIIEESEGAYYYEFSGSKLNGPIIIKRTDEEKRLQESKYHYIFDRPKENLIDELLNYIEILSSKERSEEKYYSEIQIHSELSENKTLIIHGIALKEGLWNGLFYPREEIEKRASGLVGVPLMLDHSRSVRDLVGKVTEAWYDTNVRGLRFKATVTDEPVAKKILEGLIKGVSVGVLVDRIKMGTTLTAQNYEFKELSLVLIPACTDCTIIDVEHIDNNPGYTIPSLPKP